MMCFLSCPPAQTDRSWDASGLWAVQGFSAVCCVSALTGLIKTMPQTARDTAGEGTADAAGDKKRQAPHFSPLSHLSAHLASHHG